MSPVTKIKRLIPIFIVLLSSVIIFGEFSYFLEIPIKNLLTGILSFPYDPGKNIFLPPYFYGFNIYILIYSVFFCCVVLSFLTDKIFKNKQSNFLSALFSYLFIIYTITTLLLMKSWASYLQQEIGACSGKTTEEKYAALSHANIYTLTQHYKSIFSERQSAQLITDLDLTKDPGMFEHRMLAYFLYPIDIRGIRQEAPDVIIAFEKHNAVESVPENFEVLYLLDEQNLIAARKNNNALPF